MDSLLSLKVLLIEDNPSDVLLLRTALEADALTRFELTHVERLSDGLKKLGETSFDIILADLGLPDSSGLETFTHLHEQTSHLPIVVFSGNDDESQAVEAVRAGAQDYLVKTLNGFDFASRTIRYAIERNKLQSAVRENEERLKGFLDDTPDAIVIVNDRGSIILFNTQAENLFGYPSAEVLDQNIDVLIPEQFQAAHAEYCAEYFAHPKRREMNASLGLFARHKDGHTIPVEITLSHHKMGDESVVLSAIRDITERKQAEEELRESEERLGRVMEGSQLGYWDWNIETGKVYRNARWAEMLGYTLDEIEFNVKQWTDLHHPDDREMAWKSIQDHLEGQTPQHRVEYRMLTKQGEYKWILDQARIVQRDGQGRPLRMCGTHTDITERKRAEQELRAVREIFQKIFTTSPVPIALSRPSDRIIVDVNAAMEDLLGYTRADLVGKPSINFDYWADPQERKRAFEILLTGGRLRDFEFSFKTKAGVVGKALNYTEIFEQDGEKYFLSIFVDITGRKQTEEKLRASEERYRTLVENMNEVVMEVDEHGNFCYISPSYQTLSGYSSEEELNTSAFTHVHPEDLPALLQALEKGSLDGQKRFEYRVLDKRGEWLWIETSARTFQTEEGKTHIIGVARNITEQKLAEEKLRDSEKKYRELINGMNDTVWVIDFDTAILDVNETASAVLGYTREELLSMKVSDIDLSIKPEQIQHLASAMPVDKSQIFEGVHSTRDGRQIPVEISSTLITYQGRTVIMSIARDITERKQAEEAIRASEERLRKILQTTSDGFWLVDSNRRFLDVNDAYCAMSGYARDELLSMTISDVEAVEAVSATNERIHRIMNEGRDLFESRHRRKDGTLFDVEVSVNLLGQGTGLMVCLCRDITERKKVAQTLQESQERYRQFINQSFEAISRTEFDQPVDTSLPVEEQIDQIYANAYMAECNQAMAEMYKTPLEQFIGTRMIDAHGGRDNPTNRAAFRRFILNGYKSIDDETIEYDAQGDQHWFLSNTVGTVEDGKLIRLWGTSIEITDRKKAEAALRESNERFQQIAGTIQEVFWIFDNLQQRLLYVSPGLENLWGRPVPSLDEVTRLTMEIVFPEDRPLHLHLQEEQIEGRPTDGEYRITHADGTIRWLHSRSFPILGESGTVVRTTGIITDISHRKRTEQEVKDRQQLLEKVIQLGKKITAVTDLDECLHEIYQSARFGLGFDRIGLFLYDGSLQHILGVQGTTRTGQVEGPGFFDGPLSKFGTWQKALQSPIGISWLEDYQKEFNLPQGHEMYGVRNHLTVAAWSGEKPVALIAADNLLTDRDIQPAEIEALHLFAGYVGLAIENATLNAELELKVEERTVEVQDLYDNAPTGYHSLDSNGYFIQINQTELTWLGYTREEVIGHPIGEFITEHSRAIFQQNFPKFKQEGRLRDLELDMVRKDGSVFPVLVNATAILDGHGSFIMSRTTVFDHSERKSAEQALRDSQANLQNFLDTASDMIQSLDERGKYIYVNNAWCDALGYTQEEATQLTMFDVVDPRFHEHCRATMQELVATGQPQQLEIVFRTKTGESIVAEGSVSGRTIKGGESVTNGIFRNITKRKQAEESLRRANLELERALRMKDEFLASMSHELRTPLTGILGLSEALQYDTYGELNPKQKSILANIENNGRHLLDLINDILDISKMEAGKLELEMNPCTLSEICQSSLQLVKGMAQKKGQQVAFSMNPTDIVVKGDPRRLKQILVNLLSNAVKYSPGNSPIGLDVHADPTNHIVKLEVWDNGMGIPPEDLNRLFQPFVQLDSSLSRHQTGTGLGLALVQKLVDLHGGGIQVESTPGLGSRFIVTLPSLSTTVESKQEPEERLPQIHDALVVEDRATDSGRLTRSLKMLGIYSTVLTTGAGVLEEAARLQPGVILLDLDLPEVSGWEVLEQLKHNDLTRTIPVVITSVVDERERATQLGAAGYLVKFFTLDELRYTLSHLPQAGRVHHEITMSTSPTEHFGTIMIVDDNETNIMMIDDFLHSKNYNVVTSLSGIDFLDRVPDIQPDLVLMDIQMPDMDGLETIRRLRHLPEPRLARVPVIAITALAMPGDRERCLEAGANEYISKPIRLKELVSLIQTMLISRDDPGE